MSVEVYNKLVIDSIIFFVFIALSIVYVKKNCVRGERFLMYAYVFITYSSFNIFIKPVQDYLIPIPRTFIFYYKVIGGVSVYDIFLILSCMLVFSKIFIDYRKILILFANNTLSLFLKRDIALLLISTLGFLLYYFFDNPCDVVAQFRIVRDFLNAILMVYITLKFITKCDSPVKCRRILIVLCTLNFFNFLSQFISSFVLQGISWERGGHPVVLLDQTEGLLAMLYLPFLLVKSKLIPLRIVLISFFSILLIFINYIKAAYLMVGITILVFFILGLIKRIMNMRLILLAPMVFIAIIFYSYVFFQSSTGDRLSRVGQIESLEKSLEDKPFFYLIGIGQGGMILRQTTSTDDEGEIRAIDMDKNSKYQVAFQVPIISFIKQSGIIGLCIVLWLFVVLICRAIHHIRRSMITSAQYTSLAVMSLFGGSIIRFDPQAAIFLCEFYVFIIFTAKLISMDTKNIVVHLDKGHVIYLRGRLLPASKCSNN